MILGRVSAMQLVETLLVLYCVGLLIFLLVKYAHLTYEIWYLISLKRYSEARSVLPDYISIIPACLIWPVLVFRAWV